MGWIFLMLAIVMEVAGTTSMKLSEGFTKLIPSVALFIFYALSFTSLTFALKQIPLSIAYAVWAGMGTALISVLGIFWFKESWDTIKTISIGLIILGVIGLNLRGDH
jgi:small multidrug resistance pump